MLPLGRFLPSPTRLFLEYILHNKSRLENMAEGNITEDLVSALHPMEMGT